MQNGFYDATGGMVTQFNRLDLISNNLANTNTNAYKRDDVIVGDFMRLYKEMKEELPLNNHTRDAAQFLNRSLNRVPIIVEEYVDTSIGNFYKSENPLDIALKDKNAYIVIKTPNGIRYTRDGALNINDEGILTTSMGYHVVSKENIDDGSTINVGTTNSNIEINGSGDIYIRELNNENIGNPQPVGSIAIVSFVNSKYLKKIGNNLYEFPDERLHERKTINNDNVVLSGFIEKSNVNPIREMTALIDTNRLVEMYSKVMKTYQDDINAEAISKLAQKI